MSISDWYCQKCGFKNGAVSFCGECGGPKLFPENIRGFFYYLILAVLFLALSFFLLVLTTAVPTFADVFASFGAKLPAPTALVINVGNAIKPLKGLLFLGIVGLTGVFAAVPGIKRKMQVRYLFLVLLFVALVIAFCVLVLFQPMFEIGNTVQ